MEPKMYNISLNRDELGKIRMFLYDNCDAVNGYSLIRHKIVDQMYEQMYEQNTEPKPCGNVTENTVIGNLSCGETVTLPQNNSIDISKLVRDEIKSQCSNLRDFIPSSPSGSSSCHTDCHRLQTLAESLVQLLQAFEKRLN